jgi:hypothetical protein
VPSWRSAFRLGAASVLLVALACQAPPPGATLPWPEPLTARAAVLALHGSRGLTLSALDLDRPSPPPPSLSDDSLTRVELLLYDAPLPSLLLRAGVLPQASSGGNPLPPAQRSLMATVQGGVAGALSDAPPSAELSSVGLEGQGRPRCPSIALESVPIDASENLDFLLPVWGGRALGGAPKGMSYRLFLFSSHGARIDIASADAPPGLAVRAAHEEPSGALYFLDKDGGLWRGVFDERLQVERLPSPAVRGDARQLIARETPQGPEAYVISFFEQLGEEAHAKLLRVDSATVTEVGRVLGRPVDANFLGLLWLDDGSVLAGAGSDGTLIRWRPAERRLETIPVAAGNTGIAGLALHPSLGVLAGMVDGRIFRQPNARDLQGDWEELGPHALAHGVQAFAPYQDGFVFTEYTANYGAYTPSSGICTYYQFPDRLGSNARWMVPFGGGWLLSGPRNTSSAIVNFLEVLPPPLP